MRKSCITSVVALALAVFAAPVAKLQAAGLVGLDSKPQASGLIQVAKAKKKAKAKAMKRAKRKAGRTARSKGPGRCGENMYFKKGKCMDARDKA